MTARRRSRKTPRPISVAVLRRLAGPVIAYLGRPPAQVEVEFLENGIMRGLKRDHLGKNVDFVDVLAFPEPAGFPHPEGGLPALGEIYLNRTFRTRPRRCVELFVHGLHHLLGFSHDRKRDTMVMERSEREVCERIRLDAGTPRFVP